MKKIRRRLFILAGLCSLGLLASLSIITGNIHSHGFNGNLYAYVSVFLTIFIFALSAREYKRLAFALMIIENRIISIQAAQTEQKSLKGNNVIITADTIDIYVSCFGILLGSKIIKFNTEDIHLKKIDIGKDFVSIYFGKNENEQYIRLQNRITEDNELANIIERFRHETGVIPNIVE
ncbi:MAG TPA: hypothetical protein PLL98_08565 [Bacillota bacterium]|nr:hypothetical protein [Bacillota bacterium]HOR86525.1 hypothetical protein [Bacillota bacterium]HPL52520.1 hypothetical protein [Bacillota bacterium]